MTPETWISAPMLEVWRLLGSLLGTLVILVATLWASQHLLVQARTVWRTIRGSQDAILAAVDEPGDPLIRPLAQLSSVPDVVWAAFLSAFFRALATGLDQALGGSLEETQDKPG